MTHRGLHTALLHALLVLGASSAWPQALQLAEHYLPGEKIRFKERADLRRYEDGRFVGLAYREVQGVMNVSADGTGSRLQGDFYVFEETKHDTRLVAKRIDEVVPVSLTMEPNGESRLTAGQDDPGYPSLRSFPVLPAGPVQPGASWQAFGERVVEPFRDGKFTRVRIYSDYKYIGTEVRNGREVGVIRAQYAVRYRAGQDPYGDSRIKSISGTHVVTIYYDVAAARPVHMSDQTEEQYTLDGGKSLGFKGFILTWFDSVQPMNRAELAEDVKEKLEEGGAQGVEVSTAGSRGVTLTVNSIHFVADQATILPQERGRLDTIAAALKAIPDRTFLVVGHTAKFGTVESMESLSVARAKAIVDELASRGIEASRFIYEGRGAREPVAPNDTEENMARNRRVEIVILED